MHQLHCEEVLPLLGAARFVDSRDGGMPKARKRLGLTLEHTDLLLVDVPAAADHLECNEAPRALLLGLVHDPHSPLADLSDDPVGPDASFDPTLSGSRDFCRGAYTL